MSTSRMKTIVEQVCKLGLRHDDVSVGDRELLARFVTQHDEEAFAAIVRRHGPMVMGVCLRILGKIADAEDAFQATFLVLVRRSASIVSRELLANWLYKVAYHTALKAKASLGRRKAKEQQLMEMPAADGARGNIWEVLEPLLDEELARLPDKYRIPIVLCHFEGKSHKEAARQLGWPIGTLSGRLSRARKMLADRLARRGVALPASAQPAVLSVDAASASVPSAVASATIRTAVAMVTGQTVVTAAIPPKVLALTEGVLKAMFLSRLRGTTCVLLAVTILAAGIGLSGRFQDTQAAFSEGGQKPLSQKTSDATEPVGAANAPRKKFKVPALHDLDERKIVRVSAPTAGKIEKIFKSTGDRVKKGEALAKLYSPEVYTAVRELLAVQLTGKVELDRIAREKLRFWGMGNEKIKEIVKTGNLVSHLTIHSPIEGYVIVTRAYSGTYVKQGDPVYDLAELDTGNTKKIGPAKTAKVQLLRKERLDVLQQIAAHTSKAYSLGQASFQKVWEARHKVLKAKLELADSAKERLAIHAEILKLAKEQEAEIDELYRSGKTTVIDALKAREHRMKAEIALERVKGEASAVPK